ncbi:MAG: NUDIX hydrolase [Mycobacteriales bacterium]
MTVRPSWLRAAAYRTFYRLPRRVQVQLVRRLTPNYTVGAVVLLRDPDHRLLLVRQPHAIGWSLPGGLAERHEAPAQTAARELAEEIDVRLDASAIQPANPNARVDPVSQQVDLVFTATVPASLTLRTDPAEIAAVDWYSPDALPALTPPTQALLGLYELRSAPADLPVPR